MKSFILLSLFVFSTFAAAETCPLGRNEDHLTIQRVMINFGKYTMDADWVALKYKNPYLDVSEARMTKAIHDLDLAMACADEVVANPTGDLKPAGLEDTRNFVKFMKEFSNSLYDYQVAITDVLNTEDSQRNYEQVYKIYEYVDELVMRAHREIGFESHGQKIKALNARKLGEVMEEIGDVFNLIKKSVNNAAQNKTNEDRAKELAALFNESLSLIPAIGSAAQYQNLIQQEMDLSIQLAQAFSNNDNKSAAALVTQMNNLKIDGHGTFDP